MYKVFTLPYRSSGSEEERSNGLEVDWSRSDPYFPPLHQGDFSSDPHFAIIPHFKSQF
jgi:hypothetical protein